MHIYWFCRLFIRSRFWFTTKSDRHWCNVSVGFVCSCMRPLIYLFIYHIYLFIYLSTYLSFLYTPWRYDILVALWLWPSSSWHNAHSDLHLGKAALRLRRLWLCYTLRGYTLQKSRLIPALDSTWQLQVSFAFWKDTRSPVQLYFPQFADDPLFIFPGFEAAATICGAFGLWFRW